MIEQLAWMEVALDSLAGLPDGDTLEGGGRRGCSLELFTEVLLEETGTNSRLVEEGNIEPMLAAVDEFERLGKPGSPTRANASSATQ